MDMEGAPKQTKDLEVKKEQVESPETEKKKMLEAIVMHAAELSERAESIPFTGIDADSYANMKAEEEEFPGMTTPIDELIVRFKEEGMRVVLGKDPKSGNVSIVPWGSTDPISDSVLPRHLDISDAVMMDAPLRELIHSSREHRRLAQVRTKTAAVAEVPVTPEPPKEENAEGSLQEKVIAEVRALESQLPKTDFEKERAQLLEEAGYEVKANSEQWLAVAKNGYEIRLRHYEAPGELGYQKGRISTFVINVNGKEYRSDRYWGSDDADVPGKLSGEALQIFEELVALLN